MTSSRYSATEQAAVARLEDGKDFDAATGATDKVSRIFQVVTPSAVGHLYVTSHVSGSASPTIAAVHRGFNSWQSPMTSRLVHSGVAFVIAALRACASPSAPSAPSAPAVLPAVGLRLRQLCADDRERTQLCEQSARAAPATVRCRHRQKLRALRARAGRGFEVPEMAELWAVEYGSRFEWNNFDVGL